jgi:hypothetical protein
MKAAFRGNRMNRSIALLAVAVFFVPALAEASAQGTQVIKNWKSSDKCSQQAQTAFPDFTPESNAKRDAQLKACLEGQRLAPRAPNGPSQ